MKLVDLSIPIDNDISIYPGDTSAFLIQEKFRDKDEYCGYRLEIGLHTGTHIDAPMHMTENNRYINEYDLQCFCGNALLLDVRDEKVIRYKERYESIVNTNDIILFYTGHDSTYRTSKYFTDHPVLDIELAEFLAAGKIKMIGLDTPSPDNAPYIIHKKLFENGILIIENLTNLGELLNKKFEIYAFPLNIKADSSLVRVVAKII